MRRERGRLLLALALAVAAPAAPAGQVTTDGRLGPAQVLSGPYYSIAQSLGAVRGANLFHSFGLFSLSSGDTADFQSSGMTSIIARVTGGSLSGIDGTLRAQQPGANLYLVNPGGIRFGPNARLDVAGSFYASTASYLKLADGGRFDASNPGNSVLTAARPAAFGFLGPKPAAIAVNGSSLFVPEGRAIGLVGGNVILDRGAAVGTAGSGAAHLVSAASAGEAKPGAGAFDVASFERLGEVTISGNSVVDVSEKAGFSGGGTIYIRAGKLAVDGSKLNAVTAVGKSGGVDIAVSGDIHFANGASVETSSTGAGRGGDATIAASETVSMSDTTIDSSAGGDGPAGKINIGSGSLNLTSVRLNSSGAEPPGSGGGGGITIRADRTISIKGGSNIGSETFNAARGGDIDVSAGGRVTMDNSILTSEAWKDGDAGHIRIRAAELILLNGASILSFGGVTPYAGRGGDITIATSGRFALDSSSLHTATSGHGDAGKIDISSASVRLTGNSIITSSATGGSSGSGRGGSITIRADGAVSLAESSLILSQSLGPARSGDIGISAGGRFTMDSGTISVNALENGDSGNIRIRTADVVLRNFSFIESNGSAAPYRGKGGSIAIGATGGISLELSFISSDALGDGAAGKIELVGGKLALANGSFVSSDTYGAGRGGSIVVRSPGGISLDFSYITSEALGDGAAGKIEIVGGRLALANYAVVSSNTYGAGRGGSITVRADAVTLASGGRIESGTFQASLGAPATGPGGDIRINAGLLSIDGTEGAGFGTGLLTESGTVGDAGDIVVTVDRLALTAGGILSASSFGAGRGGNVSVFAATGASIAGGSAILATSSGAGSAGSITVNAGSRLTLDGGSIRTSTLNADGGDIRVVARDLVHLNRGSISSSVQGGTGNGGNIFIDPVFVILTNGASIVANAFGGNGGNITIQAGHLLQSPDSAISASSQLGISGAVVVSAPALDLSGGLQTLPASYLDRSGLLVHTCAAHIAGKAGSFVVAARGGVPVEPDNWLSGLGGIFDQPPVAAGASPVFQPAPGAGFPMFASAVPNACGREKPL